MDSRPASDYSDKNRITLRANQLRVLGLDSDPGKVERHRGEGRRVLYADAEDPGLWSGINLRNVHTVMLCMPELSAKLLAIQQLRARGFGGQIHTTALFAEEVKSLRNKGADLTYNYYESIGPSFAEKTLQGIKSPPSTLPDSSHQ